MEMNASKRYTLISGATGGIGSAFAAACAARGENLLLTARSAERLSALRQELLAMYPSVCVEICACDLADESSRAALFAFARGKGMRFSRLCNVAGVDIQKAFEKFTQEKIALQCRVNLEAAVSLTHFVLDDRAERLEIVTIGSISAVYPMPYFALYSATKKAEESFFLALRVEMRGKGVRVTVVEPGGVYTRPDICKDIEGQGLWGRLSAKQPSYIAEKSLAAVHKNRRVYRPGFWNKCVAVVPRILPLSWRMRFIARRWSRQEKDAF